MMARPTRHVLFDMNGTLLDPAVMAEPLGGRDEDVDLVHGALEATVLAAMTETVIGVHHGFADLLSASVDRALFRDGRPELAGAVTDATARMEPFPEAPEAIELLRSAGFGVGVLTNSSAETARDLLSESGLELDPILSCDAVGAFKPAAAVYRYGCEQVGLPAARVTMVAAHWWDIAGAANAGLETGWVSRREQAWLEADPDLVPAARGADLLELARALVD